MLFDAKGKSLIDELRRAPWLSEEERKAFVERFIASGEVPVKPLVAAALGMPVAVIEALHPFDVVPAVQ